MSERTSRFPNYAPVRIDSWAGARAPSRALQSERNTKTRREERRLPTCYEVIYPSIRSFVRPSTYLLDTYLPLSIHPSIRPSVCPSVRTYACPSVPTFALTRAVTFASAKLYS